MCSSYAVSTFYSASDSSEDEERGLGALRGLDNIEKLACLLLFSEHMIAFCDTRWDDIDTSSLDFSSLADDRDEDDGEPFSYNTSATSTGSGSTTDDEDAEEDITLDKIVAANAAAARIVMEEENKKEADAEFKVSGKGMGVIGVSDRGEMRKVGRDRGMPLIVLGESAIVNRHYSL